MSMPNPNPNTPWYLVTEMPHYLHGQIVHPGQKVQYVGKPGKHLVLLDGPNGKPVDPNVVIGDVEAASHETSDPRKRRRVEAVDVEAAATAAKDHRRDPRDPPGKAGAASAAP